MAIYGAIDWSGTTALREETNRLDLYCCGLAAVPNLVGLSAGLQRIRAVYGMTAGEEFHAHALSEPIQLAVLQEAISHGLRIAAVRYDKSALQQLGKLPKPSEFASVAALILLEQCLPFMDLDSLVFDEDIQGDQRQKAFLTEVRRVARSSPESNPEPSRLRTRFVRSRSHDLVQVADIIVYNLSRDARQAIRIPDLQACIHELCDDPRTILLDLPG